MTGWVRGCMVGLMARCHDPVQVDEGYGGANFIFKGYFSTLGMAALWPLRNLQQKSTGRWYGNLVTPKPDAVDDDSFLNIPRLEAELDDAVSSGAFDDELHAGAAEAGSAAEGESVQQTRGGSKRRDSVEAIQDMWNTAQGTPSERGAAEP